ncbi:MAG: hypothetical protein Q7S52_00280 [bacterium]|nr:hypothetical protein [bacterium]
MINLLPPAEKKQLRREYWFRLGVVVLVAVFLLEVFGLLAFVPAYYALTSSTGDLAKSISERKALTPEDNAEVGRDLASIKKEIGILALAETAIDTPPSTLLEEIIPQRPQGIEFSAFAYVRADNPTIQLSGIAATQEDLLAFRRNMQANVHVSDFKYGSSFITQKADIHFSATINFK